MTGFIILKLNEEHNIIVNVLKVLFKVVCAARIASFKNMDIRISYKKLTIALLVRTKSKAIQKPIQIK